MASRVHVLVIGSECVANGLPDIVQGLRGGRAGSREHVAKSLSHFRADDALLGPLGDVGRQVVAELPDRVVAQVAEARLLLAIEEGHLLAEMRIARQSIHAGQVFGLGHVVGFFGHFDGKARHFQLPIVLQSQFAAPFQRENALCIRANHTEKAACRDKKFLHRTIMTCRYNRCKSKFFHPKEGIKIDYISFKI